MDNDLRPSNLPKFITIGFVGKREIEPDYEKTLKDKINTAFDELSVMFRIPFEFVGLSALAMGGDTLFAEVCDSRIMYRQVYLPVFPSAFFELRYFRNSSLIMKRSQDLLDGKKIIEKRMIGVSYDQKERFAETGFAIADDCDILFAICTKDDYGLIQAAVPDKSIKRGGTVETVRYAQSIQRNVYLFVLDKDVNDQKIVNSEKIILSNNNATTSISEYFDQKKPFKDVRTTLKQLSAYTSTISKREKLIYQLLGSALLLSHTIATFIAAYSAVIIPANIYYLKLKILKVVLLAFILGIAWLLHHRRNQKRWAKARLLAELSRSARVLLQNGDEKSPPFPGALSFMTELHLPNMSDFVKSLTTLHLIEIKKYNDTYKNSTEHPDTIRIFCDNYSEKRIGSVSTDGQLTFYRKRMATAKNELTFFDIVFFFCIILSLVLAVAVILSHHLADLNLVKVLLLTLPVIAASIIAWVGIRDLDREKDRYREMKQVLEDSLPKLKVTETLSQVKRRVHHLERALLQEVVEWYARTNTFRT